MSSPLPEWPGHHQVEARQRLQSQPRGVGKTRPPWEEDEGLAVLEQDYRLGSEGVKNCLQSFS